MGHRYGPHRAEDAPTTITVRGRGRYEGERVVPLHPAVVRQRQQINDHAHREAIKQEGSTDA